MNIGIVCHELPPTPVGGIGTFTVELIRGLTSQGHSVHAVGVDHNIESDVCEVMSPQWTIHRLAAGQGRTRGYLNRVKLLFFIRKLAAEKQIDIVEVPDFEGWCAGWPRLPVPVVVRLHGSTTYFAGEMRVPVSSAMKLAERLGLQRAEEVISASRYTADRTKELFGLPLSPTVIYNCVMPPESGRVKTDYQGHDLVCYTGTLVQKKGVFSLARAWPLIKARRPAAKLLMMGKDGRHECRSSMDVIRELAGSCADSIEMIGHLPKEQMEILLSTADVAVFPSYSETFALAPMEAMALGVPTIYSARASGRELMRHGVDGYLCDPDNIERLAEQVTTLLEDENKRRQLGAAGRRRISEDFPYETGLRQNIETYQRCIREHGSRFSRPEPFRLSIPVSK